MIGFLNLYKESGISSFGALRELKKICSEKKLGHAGTLDPMATGVLPIAFGRAAKFIDLLPDEKKGYIADFQLGIRTDTLDITGKILQKEEVRVPEEEVMAAAKHFLGEIWQVPPMFSALSKNGVRYYELARKGMEIPREARKIQIHQISFLPGPDEKTYRISVICGKGTYIRSLISDIGDLLGVGAVMTALERTMSNGFLSSKAVTLAKVRESMEEGSFSSLLLPVDQVFEEYPALTITEKQAKRFQNGGSLSLDRLHEQKDSPLQRVYSPAGQFLGLGEKEDDFLKVKKLYQIND